ncbi:MAG: iron-sulfur cluster repair di-iron protein [Flavisolibacter sp.]
MQELSNKTLSQIVTDHYQAARVFENHGLDFCCKGKRPLTEACEEKKISIEQILNELNIAFASGEQKEFNNMSLTELAEYIVRVHHGYVKLNMPQIFSYLHRVASKHGDHFPFMKEVYSLFGELQEEFVQHLMKEEQVLFPRIKIMELKAADDFSNDYLQAPIEEMEDEHDHAGAIMEKIRNLTNNYTAPDQACTTFRLSLEALKAFEEDLHQHVHLENNILFPKAIRLFTPPSSCSIQR